MSKSQTDQLYINNKGNLIRLDEGVRNAKLLIIKGEAEEANKQMFDILHDVKDDFDEAAVELLPAYFILAEANVIMGGVKLK